MPFAVDLCNLFEGETIGRNLKEEELFTILAEKTQEAAVANGIGCQIMIEHKKRVRFNAVPRVPFYTNGRGYCEISDLMFVIADVTEARLCFMQNKYDRRVNNHNNFKANVKQLYLLRNRPSFIMDGTAYYNNILANANYSSIGNYGIFYKEGDRYDMKYYNAGELPAGAIGPRQQMIALPFGDEYSSISSYNDQLNYAINMQGFAEGLVNMKIGQKYRDRNDLLNAVNNPDLNEYFRGTREIDENRPTIEGRILVVLEIQNQMRQ